MEKDGSRTVIIDIHTHTFPEKIAEKALRTLQGNCHTALFSDGTEAGLLRNEQKAGVDLAVVQPVATYPEQVPHINDAVIRSAAERKQGILSFGAMHPLCSVWEAELERLAEAGVPGIKLHAPFEEVDMDDARTVRVLKKCRELGLRVLIHSGWDVGLPGHAEALPEKIRRGLDAAGEVRLIAGHMGGWKCWEEAGRLLAGCGIWLDTAFSLEKLTPAEDGYAWKKGELEMLSPSEFCDLAHLFGTDHILFGTDSPWADPKEELKKIRDLPLTKEEISGICGGNAEKLLSGIAKE